MNKPDTINATARELIECGEHLVSIMWGVADVAGSEKLTSDDLDEVRSAQDDWNRAHERMKAALVYLEGGQEALAEHVRFDQAASDHSVGDGFAVEEEQHGQV